MSGSGSPLPSGNLRSSGTPSVTANPTDIIQALGGHIGGWWIENQRLSADGGNAKIDANVPSISLGAASAFLTGVGIWQGKDGGVYKWRVGNPAAQYIKWDNADLTIVGGITATTGAIGGWTINATSISSDSGNVSINSGATPSIKMGLASDYLTGAGFFVGKSSGAYKFHIGDPAGDYVGWSGSTMVAGGNWITGNALNLYNVPVLNGATFTSNSPVAGSVAWNSFTLTHNGTSYTIVAGNTANKYVWWNQATSTTVLQSSDTIPNGAVNQFVVCLNFSGTAIPSLFQSFVYADYIKVAQLSALSADMGSITAGTITGGTIRTAASGARVQMDGSYLAGYGSDGTTKQFYLGATDGKAYAGGGNVTLDANGMRLNAAIGKFTTASIDWYQGATNKFSIGTRVDLGAPVTAYISSPLPVEIEGSTSVTIQTQAGGDLPLYVRGGLVVGTLSSIGTGDGKFSGSYIGNPRAAILCYSGSDYGTVGFGLVPTGTSGVYNYGINDTISAIVFSAGAWIFRNAPAGTAGNAATLTTRATLSATGVFDATGGFKVNAATGQTTTRTYVTRVREYHNTGTGVITLQCTKVTDTYTGGILTTAGGESGWMDFEHTDYV